MYAVPDKIRPDAEPELLYKLTIALAAVLALLLITFIPSLEPPFAATCNLLSGLEVPIPTLPPTEIRILSFMLAVVPAVREPSDAV